MDDSFGRGSRKRRARPSSPTFDCHVGGFGWPVGMDRGLWTSRQDGKYASNQLVAIIAPGLDTQRDLHDLQPVPGGGNVSTPREDRIDAYFKVSD